MNKQQTLYLRWFIGWLAIIPLLLQAQPLSVFVSVLPQKQFVEAIGGERVQVHVMVKPGASPATYEPTPKQITQIAQAQLYFQIGVPFETLWLSRIQANHPQLKIIDCRDGIQLQPFASHSAETDHAHDLDPHIWTSPPLVKQIATTILQALIAADPSGQSIYQQNHARFISQLDQLDQQIKTLLAPKQQRHFAVFHPSWGYFANTYELEQIAIEHQGKEPSARQLAQRIDQLKRLDIQAILVQQQFSQHQAHTIARAIGAKVIQVDPLAANYLENTLRFAQQLAEVLQ